MTRGLEVEESSLYLVPPTLHTDSALPHPPFGSEDKHVAVFWEVGQDIAELGRAVNTASVAFDCGATVAQGLERYEWRNPSNGAFLGIGEVG